MVPQMVMMGIITYFFSGFVVAKITFPLSLRFQAMTQRGVELSSLDVTYVASFSWWILVSSGLQGIMTLLMGQLQVRAFVRACVRAFVRARALIVVTHRDRATSTTCRCR